MSESSVKRVLAKREPRKAEQPAPARKRSRAEKTAMPPAAAQLSAPVRMGKKKSRR
jgi:hypothetical protein